MGSRVRAMVGDMRGGKGPASAPTPWPAPWRVAWPRNGNTLPVQPIAPNWLTAPEVAAARLEGQPVRRRFGRGLGWGWASLMSLAKLANLSVSSMTQQRRTLGCRRRASACRIDSRPLWLPSCRWALLSLLSLRWGYAGVAGRKCSAVAEFLIGRAHPASLGQRLHALKPS